MSIRILTGHVLDRLADLPDESVNCIVTSPPYFGLRAYGTEPVEWPDGWTGELGQEPTLDLFIEHVVLVFRECRRVLRSDGTCWVNVGDSSQSKQLLMVPARIALALQADGWWLRSDIIWHKPNPMPESVTDRPTNAHEHVFLLTKSARYWYDADAVREPMKASSLDRLAQDTESQAGSQRANGGAKTNGAMKAVRPAMTGNARSNPDRRASRGVEGDKQRGHSRRHAGFNDRWDQMTRDEQMAVGSNLRNVWTIATQGFPGAHFATFPEELPRRCILAGCPAGGTVLDPFSGSGTTGLVADRLGRNAILIELNPKYASMAAERIRDDAPMLAEVIAS